MVTLDEYLEIKELAKQGFSKTDIARRLGHDRQILKSHDGPTYRAKTLWKRDLRSN